MEQLRQVEGPDGPIRYWLTRKRVKNLNLRLDGGVLLLQILPRRGRRTAGAQQRAPQQHRT